MSNMWLKNPELKCVILCAGKGIRILPNTTQTPKVLLKLNKKPILDYVINYWKRFTNDFIFIVNNPPIVF